MMRRIKWYLNSPHGDFTEEIVFHLKLLHLPVSYSPVFTFEEVVLYFMPRPNIFTSECNLNPRFTVSE